MLCDIGFTVCIPVFNKARCVIRALNSIKSQVFNRYDVLIVDDGSSDSGLDIVNRWLVEQTGDLKKKFRIITQKNKGVQAARAVLFEEAKERFLTFLDADDEWLPNHLLDLSQLIVRYKDKVNVFSTAYYIQIGSVRKNHKLDIISNYCGVLNYFDSLSKSSGYLTSSSFCVDKKRVVDQGLGNPYASSIRVLKTNEDILAYAILCGAEGFAFNSSLSVVKYKDDSEASKHGDLKTINYVCNKIQKSETDNKFVMEKYISIYAKKNIVGIRLSKTLSAYTFHLMSNLMTNSLMINLYALAALFVPKKIWRRIMMHNYQ